MPAPYRDMMRGRELKALILPDLVKKRDEGVRLSRSSIASDLSSPNTPTFSLRGHSRVPSSTSSVASSPAFRESTEGLGSPKRPLTNVQEDPFERDEEASSNYANCASPKKDQDHEMVNGLDGHHDRDRKSYAFQASCRKRSLYCRLATNSDPDETPPRLSDVHWSFNDLQTRRFLEYEPADEVDREFSPNPCVKRQRAGASPFHDLTSRVGSRMPSMSRRWKSRKASPTISMPDISREPPSLSRANSSRAPSFASATKELSKGQGCQLPPTPTRSAFEDSFEAPSLSPIDVQKANRFQEEDSEDQAKPTTPLLPPLMTQIPDDIKEVPYQSPLQSPAIADPEFSSALNSPLSTPQVGGLPSPPLSTRPSVASFQRQHVYSNVVPTSEIPSTLIADHPSDCWRRDLGHANFKITPEPYVPPRPTLGAYKELLADYQSARNNYASHLKHTGEHYGAHSKIYHHTQEKWAEVEATWKRHTDACVANISETRQPVMSQSDTIPLSAKIPPLNGPKSEGKFPTLGDEGIVGPMEVVASPLLQQQEQRRKRKLGFFRWVQGVWPVGVGVFGRGTASGP